MNAGQLIDTDVIIDHLHGRREAVAFIAGLAARPFTSVIVVGELYAGVRDGAERTQLVTFLNGMTILPLEESTAVEGGLIRRKYGKSHNVGYNDAMIAATTMASNLTLVTLNKKHFPMLPDLLVPYSRS